MGPVRVCLLFARNQTALTRAHRSLHLIDRYVGIPLLLFLSLFRRRRAPLANPKRIALFNSAAIGDTLLQTGVIHDLRRHFPTARFTYFSGPSNYEAACLIQGVEVIQLPILSPFKALFQLRKIRFDFWIDFGSWPRLNALYSFFSKSRYTIGFRTAGQYRHFLYDAVVDHEAIHEKDNFRRLVSLLDVQSTTQPFLALRASALKQRVALHLYAGGSQAKSKEWPDACWIELIDRLPYPVVLTGSKKDLPRCQAIRSACKDPSKVHVLAGTLSLHETALLLKNSLATVSVDTGIMHLSSLLGCRTIALHLCTCPKRWGGIGPRVIPIEAKGTSPRLHLGFETTAPSTLSQISVEEVLDKIPLPDPQSSI